MIKELIYILIVLLGIPFGLFLKKICKEEINAWKKRLSMMIIVCFVAVAVLFFIDFDYKIQVIATLCFIIITCWSVIWKHG
jgi:hypothetical protein